MGVEARRSGCARVGRCCFFFFQAEDGIRDYDVTGVQTCALPIWTKSGGMIALTVNGETRRTAATTIAELVRELDLDPAKVAVEHNGTIAPRSELGVHTIASGDNLEIVHFVGGGQGVTPAQKKTFAAAGMKMTYVAADRVVYLAECIVRCWSDNGNRKDRKQARIKYLLREWGLDKFKAKVSEYFGSELPEPHAVELHDVEDHMVSGLAKVDDQGRHQPDIGPQIGPLTVHEVAGSRARQNSGLAVRRCGLQCRCVVSLDRAGLGTCSFAL